MNDRAQKTELLSLSLSLRADEFVESSLLDRLDVFKSNNVGVLPSKEVEKGE